MGHYSVQYMIMKKYGMLPAGRDELFLLQKIEAIEKLSKPEFIFRNNFGIKLMSEYILLCTSRGGKPDREVKILVGSVLSEENCYPNLE